MLAIGAALFVGGGFGSSDAYTVDGVENACDLVDPSPLNRWEDQRKTIEHTETPAKGDRGGSLRCLIRNQNFYDVAELSVLVSLSSRAEEGYRTWKNLAQIGTEVVEISGLGQQAYFTSDSDGCHHSADGSCLEYTIGVLDSVLNLQITLLVEVGDGRAINDSEVADVARVYAERMMASLRK
ncbi:hypothetical protein ACFWPX_16145 [Nocardia sp. NPDC058518]|uniref:hypothetical protein n=1 Tax=Nocardia sp. NPDC058518 TaxID=3346534 RepID=UPI0036632CC0